MYGKLIQVKSNSKYLVTFDNKGDQQNLHLVLHNRKIGQQQFCKIDDVYRGNYKYSVFDNDARNPDTRTRTNVFPHERTMVYI